MKQIAFIVLSVIFISGCVPASSKSGVTPVDTPVITSTTANPTPLAFPNTPTSESTTAVDSSVYIPYLKMVDAHRGWALVQGWGNHVLRTEDAGTTWHDVTPPQLFMMRADPSYSHSFFGNFVALDANTAWAVAAGGAEELSAVIWRTEDGGVSWQPGNPIQIYRVGPGGGINGFDPRLMFVNAQDGWLRARVEVVMGQYFDTWFHTSDGGLNWTRLPIGCNDYVQCNYVFVNETTGFKDAFKEIFESRDQIQTDQFWQIEKTMDGGSTWSSIPLPPPSDLLTNLSSGQVVQPSQVSYFQVDQNFAQFTSGAIDLHMHLVAYSAAGGAQPVLEKDYYYISNDQGQTWQSFPFSGDLFFLTGTIGWRFAERQGRYLLEKTTDGGATWNSVGKEIPEIGLLQFADETTGWMITDFQTDRLMRTVDGGQTWTDITASLKHPPLSNASIETPSVGLTPIPTEPGFGRMEAGAPLVLNTIHMSDANQGWGTSLNGYVFHTSDGGKSWQDVTPQYGVGMDHDFFALDAFHAWRIIRPPQGCGAGNSADQCPDYYLNHGPVWYTDDAGQTWNPGGIFPDPERTFAAEPIQIRFANETLGWAQWLSRDPNQSGALYHLYKTTDGGRTWMPLVTEHHEGDKPFLNERIGFQAGFPWPHTLADLMNGSALQVIQKTIDGGTTWEPIPLPKFTVDINDPDLDNNAFLYSAFCASSKVDFFGAKGVAIKVLCTIDDVQHLPLTKFFEYYYSADEGQSWNNWISFEYKYSSENQHQPGWEEWSSAAGEFFLGGGIGWRLYKSGPHTLAEIQHTVDAGKSWETVNAVAWQEASFNFINEQEGWVVVTNGDEVALLHTRDGGKSWEEMKPIVSR